MQPTGCRSPLRGRSSPLRGGVAHWLPVRILEPGAPLVLGFEIPVASRSIRPCGSGSPPRSPRRPRRRRRAGRPIARGESTLLLAPTGSGKTLAAFLWCINRLMFEPRRRRSYPALDRHQSTRQTRRSRCRVLYVSPLKALAVDVERNLRAPLAGIAHAATARGDAYRVPEVAVRTGDTPASERARFQREPADILITTPESLYLLLTSNARDALRSVDTVIVDEIHALVPTKRGAHLALSLERLEALRRPARCSASASRRRSARSTRSRASSAAPSAGDGAHAPRGRAAAAGRSADARRDARRSPRRTPARRRSTTSSRTRLDASAIAPSPIVDAGARKTLELRIEVPVEDMARARPADRHPERAGGAGPGAAVDLDGHPSAAARAHPRAPLDADLRQQPAPRRAARRRAQRAGRRDAGPRAPRLARARRSASRSRTRSRPASCAASSPPRRSSSASTWARSISSSRSRRRPRSRAACSASAAPATRSARPAQGVIFPKYRGDLLACAAAARAMHEGRVEATRYPRNPLDVLAQQIVAMVAMDRWHVDELFDARPPRRAVRRARSRRVRRRARHARRPLSVRRVRRAAAARHLGSRARTRITARDGAKRVAIANGGTIPDRGLYGVFLAGAPARRRARRRARRGDGVREPRRRDVPARRVDVAHRGDHARPRARLAGARASPARCRSGRAMRPARPLEFGRAIGALIRELRDAAARGRARSPRARARPRSPGGREPAAVPRRSAAARPAASPTIGRS